VLAPDASGRDSGEATVWAGARRFRARRPRGRGYGGRRMGLIQHKREAYWFYRFLSLGYDRWVNPLFWTPAMRSRALAAARLDGPELETLDAGAGTGFTTEGIVATVRPERVTMLDQSPHQLAQARRKQSLHACRKLVGDAERLPFGDDAFDRYVSAGSIEYWPDPQRGIAEAYRVLRPGGVGVVVGPVRPANPILRRLSQAWMLFPAEAEYRTWFERAGFTDVASHVIAPDWYRGRSPYALAVAGSKPAAGPSPLAATAPAEDRAAAMTLRERLRFAARFVLGSAAGAAFVPIGAALALRARLARRT
jgi:MPBQ/MSBQ methyltransferase